MGFITVNLAVENVLQPTKRLETPALVDTGASFLTLPVAWRDQLGEFDKHEEIELELADQQKCRGVLCGPVKILIEDFEPVYSEVLFVDMKPDNGEFEAILGCIPLETGRVAVDLDAHELVALKRAKLK